MTEVQPRPHAVRRTTAPALQRTSAWRHAAIGPHPTT